MCGQKKFKMSLVVCLKSSSLTNTSPGIENITCRLRRTNFISVWDNNIKHTSKSTCLARSYIRIWSRKTAVGFYKAAWTTRLRLEGASYSKYKYNGWKLTRKTFVIKLVLRASWKFQICRGCFGCRPICNPSPDLPKNWRYECIANRLLDSPWSVVPVT